ncbi:MAG: hypothetical protein WCI30_09040 [Clostridia bacterium]
MKIKMSVMAVLVFILIFGGIALTIAVDIWSTTSSKTPVTYQTGTNTGEYNPADIRGSYTFQEVATLFEIDLQVLYKAFAIEENTDGTEIQTKELETRFKNEQVEIGNESVQVFVALYKNLPITLAESYLPKQAVELILAENQQLTAEQKAYLKKYQVVLGVNSPALVVTSEQAVSSTSEAEEEPLVNGSATFQQVLDGGITVAQIEAIISKSMPPTNQTVKDYCNQEGLEFSTIKGQLNLLAE